MERKYLITQEQLEQLETFKSMFESNARSVLEVCWGENADIRYGFELGKVYAYLRQGFTDMARLLAEIKVAQSDSDVSEKD